MYTETMEVLDPVKATQEIIEREMKAHEMDCKECKIRPTKFGKLQKMKVAKTKEKV